MKEIHTVEHHTIIRETIGYKELEKIDVQDIPKVMEFLTIVYNYLKMNKLQNETIS